MTLAEPARVGMHFLLIVATLALAGWAWMFSFAHQIQVADHGVTKSYRLLSHEEVKSAEASQMVRDVAVMGCRAIRSVEVWAIYPLVDAMLAWIVAFYRSMIRATKSSISS